MKRNFDKKNYKHDLKHSIASNRFFKPIIASSLAALLGASFANAQGVECNPTDGNPSLCYNSQKTSLTGLEFPVSGDTFTPNYKDSAKNSLTPIEMLWFKFYGNTSPTPTPTPTGAWTADTKTYTISKTRGLGTYTLDGKGRGIVMGASGKGTLAVDFDPQGWDNERIFELKLGDIKADTLAFKGNILIRAGKGDGTSAEAKNGKFEATFGGKGMEGDIILGHPSSGGNGKEEAGNQKNIFTFQKGASLKGNIRAETRDGGSAATNIFTFEDGHIVGNIEYLLAHRHALGSTTITFKGENNSIKGNINTNCGDQTGGCGKNFITFEKGGSIEGDTISSGRGGTANSVFDQARNVITSNANTLTVNTKSIYANFGFNTITANGQLNLKTSSIEAHSGGKHNNKDYGYNTITAKEAALINADKIQATHSAKNTITVGKDSHLTIGSLVTTNNGQNSITVGKDSHLTIGSLATSSGTNSIVLDKSELNLKDATVAANGSNYITLKGESILFLQGDNLALKGLTLQDAKFHPQDWSKDATAQRNTIIDLAGPERSSATSFRLLQVGQKGQNAADNKGLAGENGLFRLFINTTTSGGSTLGGKDSASLFDTYGFAYSDRVIVHKVAQTNGATNTLTQHIQIFTDTSMKAEDLKNITYGGGGTEKAGNVAVFTVINNTTDKKPLVDLKAQKALSGFDVVNATLQGTATDENGKTTQANGTGLTDDKKLYTTYFIKSMGTEGISLVNQKLTASALTANYDLYLANMNSLNKRMGELRENAGEQGVWARVFNGMQTTNFALNTRAIYTTVQAGYDYTFGFKGASNYLGFALSYANSVSSIKGQKLIDIDNKLKTLTGINSNAFEFAIYNAYVQDGASKATGWKNGLYSDTILKFSYIMSNLDITAENKLNTNNFAFTFSQELGYRFLLGNTRAFYIDPQAEITLGFLNQSDLTRRLGNAFLKANQDSIFTFRGRVGASYGYKFDEFTKNKGFNSSIYLGTYFVGDAISGGNVLMQSNLSETSFNALGSTARFVLNLGTNFKIKDNTRIYFDFERSFGGRITTDYQINLGVRYSFGTSKYTPYIEASTQEIQDTNTIKEIEPTTGFYIELLEKEENGLSNKEMKTLKNIKEELRVQTKMENNKTMKVYLVGPFKDEAKAKEIKTQLEGVLKELKVEGDILEVE